MKSPTLRDVVNTENHSASGNWGGASPAIWSTATSERSFIAANWLTSRMQPWCAAQQPRSPPNNATNNRRGGARTTRRHDDVAMVPARDLLSTTARSGRATSRDDSIVD